MNIYIDTDILLLAGIVGSVCLWLIYALRPSKYGGGPYQSTEPMPLKYKLVIATSILYFLGVVAASVAGYMRGGIDQACVTLAVFMICPAVFASVFITLGWSDIE